MRTHCRFRQLAEPARVGEEVRRALAQIDPNLAVLKMETISQQVNHLMDQEQLISQLCAWFAVLALLLTSIGLYGVMTYNVARRTHEIGVRMALGAQNREVQWMILRESLFLLGIGVLSSECRRRWPRPDWLGRSSSGLPRQTRPRLSLPFLPFLSWRYWRHTFLHGVRPEWIPWSLCATSECSIADIRSSSEHSSRITNSKVRQP